jgi:D-alanyl-D-alanine carboxypeptidase
MLVPSSSFYDPDVIGGKVGITTQARHTMSTVARSAGKTFVCVVLDSPSRDDKFADTSALLDYGFDNFTLQTIDTSRYSRHTVDITDAGQFSGQVALTVTENVSVLVRNDLSVSDAYADFSALPQTMATGQVLPQSVNIILPSIDTTLPDVIASVKINASLIYNQDSVLAFNETGGVELTSDEINYAVVYTLGGACAAGVMLIVVGFLLEKTTKSKRRRKHHARR